MKINLINGGAHNLEVCLMSFSLKGTGHTTMVSISVLKLYITQMRLTKPVTRRTAASKKWQGQVQNEALD